MLQSLKQWYGRELGATDGELGHLKDFYFDDQSWAVRYVIADTGTWLAGRQVLIAPHAFGSLATEGKTIPVNLTRKQIENCPAIETHQPVSRQYEQDYYLHYGWPGYWQGAGLWGMSAFPILESPHKSKANQVAAETAPPHKTGDAHLRSAQAVAGYHLSASDGVIGHVCDFRMDDRTWAIGQLVIKIGHRFSGREVLIPASAVERISYEDSTVFTRLAKYFIENHSEEPAPASR